MNCYKTVARYKGFALFRYETGDPNNYIYYTVDREGNRIEPFYESAKNGDAIAKKRFLESLTSGEMKHLVVNRKKGSCGENNGMSKISYDDVLRIRKYSEMGMSDRKIAESFPITEVQVRNITIQHSWTAGDKCRKPAFEN